MSDPAAKLSRNLTLPQVSLYGLGNSLGAGIYVLIGEIAGIAGYLAPFAFLLAATVAAFTAFTFAEFSARFPFSGGGALFVHKGFNKPALTVAVGALIVLTGIISAATIARGFVGYLNIFIVADSTLTLLILVAALCALACWGIQQSVVVAALITMIEVLGLLLIIWIAQTAEVELQSLPADSQQYVAGNAAQMWTGLMGGSFLAFYAYVGFEDIVNVAEETKKPEPTMPKAILIALVVATLLYAVTTASALSILTPTQLAQSDAPLAAVFETATGSSPWFISLISMFAVINGALIQIIMCSRIGFGLAQEKLLPTWIGKTNARTQTPINATIVVSLLIVLAAVSLSTETLARFTTTVLLIVFVLVNIALLKVKRSDSANTATMNIPSVLPLIGALASAGFLLVEAYAAVQNILTS